MELRFGEIEIEGGEKKEKTHPNKIYRCTHEQYGNLYRIHIYCPSTVQGIKEVEGVRPLRAECSSQRRHLRFQQHGIATAKTHVRFVPMTSHPARDQREPPLRLDQSAYSDFALGEIANLRITKST